MSELPSDVLRRRARRHSRAGDHRKAAVALRELVATEGDAATWAMLGAMWSRARRPADALAAYRQSLWLHRRAGAEQRARSVARIIVGLDPADERARALLL